MFHAGFPALYVLVLNVRQFAAGLCHWAALGRDETPHSTVWVTYALEAAFSRDNYWQYICSHSKPE